MASTVTRSPARQNAPRGRTESNKGAPVHNPTPGPVFHPQIYPIRARIPMRLRLAGPYMGVGLNDQSFAMGQTQWNSGTRASSLTFDNSQAAHGYLSYRVTTGTYPTGTARLQWSQSLQGSWLTLYYRAYLFYTGNPIVASTPVSLASGSSTAAQITINSSGSLELFDAAGAGHNTFTSPIPLNAWFRIEGYVIGRPSGGTISCTLYGPLNSTTAIESHTATGVNTTGLLTKISYGESNAGYSEGPFWVDDIGVSNTGYLGPVLGESPPPALSEFFDSISLPSVMTTFPSM